MSIDARSVTKTEAAFRRAAPGDRGRPAPPRASTCASAPGRGPADEPDPDPRGAAHAAVRGPGGAPAHRGTTVAEYSPEDAAEVYALRLRPRAAWPPARRRARDGRPARRAAPAAHGAGAAHRRLRTDVQRGGAQRAWHRAVYTACASRYLQEFISRLWQALPGARSGSRAARRCPSSSTSASPRARAARSRAAFACMREHIALGADLDRRAHALRRPRAGLLSDVAARAGRRARAPPGGPGERAGRAAPGAHRGDRRELNAYITVTADQAGRTPRRRTHAAPAASRLGPLDGFPIAVKDNIDVAGVPATARLGGSSPTASRTRTQRSCGACAPRGPSSSARSRCTSSPTARRPTTRTSAPAATRGTPTACRAAPAAARAPRSAPTCASARSGPTPAARSASRRRSTA